jgi:hypothetical protein
MMTGECLIEKPIQRFLDLVEVVPMHAVEQAAVDQAEDVSVADLDGKTEKSAGTPIAMPSLPNCFRSLGRHADHPLVRNPLQYNRSGRAPPLE